MKSFNLKNLKTSKIYLYVKKSTICYLVNASVVNFNKLDYNFENCLFFKKASF